MTNPQDTLAQWLEQSETVRARMMAGGGKAGVADPSHFVGKTGLEQMHAMLSGVMP